MVSGRLKKLMEEAISDPITVIILFEVALYTALFSLVLITRYHSFAFSEDLGETIQAIHTTAFYGLPLLQAFSTSFIEFNESKAISYLINHFSPILFVLVPFYRLLPSVETLLIMKALITALSAIPAYLIARYLLGSKLALVTTTLYLMHPHLHSSTLANWPPNTFMPLLFLATLYCYKTHKKLFWPLLVLSLSIHEFAGILLATYFAVDRVFTLVCVDGQYTISGVIRKIINLLYREGMRNTISKLLSDRKFLTSFITSSSWGIISWISINIAYPRITMYTLTPMEILFRFKDPHFILTSLALIGYACIPFAFLPLRSWYLMSLLPFVVWAVSFKYMGIDSIGWHQGYYYIHFLYIAFVDGLNIAVTSWSTGGQRPPQRTGFQSSRPQRPQMEQRVPVPATQPPQRETVLRPSSALPFRIRTRSDSKVCPSCGASVEIGAASCPSCGFRFPVDVESGCPVCRSPLNRLTRISPNLYVCGVCFSELEKVAAGLKSAKNKRLWVLLVIALTSSMFLTPLTPIFMELKRGHGIAYSPTPYDDHHIAVIHDVLKLIPNSATVVAQSPISIALANRLYTFIYMPKDLLPDYIIMDFTHTLFKTHKYNQLLEKSLDQGYGIYAYADGVLLLKRDYQGDPIILEPLRSVIIFPIPRLWYWKVESPNGIMFDPQSSSQLVLRGEKNPLWFGPHIPLMRGTYQLTFRIKIEGAFNYEDPLMVFDVSDVNKRTILKTLILYGKNVPKINEYFNVTLFFSAYDEFTRVEFRGFKLNGAVNVYLDYIELHQINFTVSPYNNTFIPMYFNVIKGENRLFCAIHKFEESEGTFVFGPYITLPRGHYVASFYVKINSTKSFGDVMVFDVYRRGNILAQTKLTSANISTLMNQDKIITLSLHFDLENTYEDIEFRIHVLNNVEVMFFGVRIYQIH
jgi:uncharacterized membrane protein